MYTKSEHGNNTAQREATRIAHKHLSRERIIPQKPIVAPIKALAKTTSSSLPGIYMIFKYDAYAICPDR